MKILLACTFVAILRVASPIGATPETLPIDVLTVSGSDGEPEQAQIPTFVGERSVYLWWSFPGMSVSEFELQLGGDFEIVAVIPRLGLENLGTVEEPLLSKAQGCLEPDGNVILAEIVIRDEDGSGGQLCLEPASQSERLCLKRCSDNEWWSGPWEGLTTESLTALCRDPRNNELPSCNPIPVEKTTWGMVKARYR